MRIGVPTEIKANENRIGLVPESVSELIKSGHQVYVQRGAGTGIQASNEDFVDAGAIILEAGADIYEQSELIVKVKEPQPAECLMLKPHHTLFTYLHLAADVALTNTLVTSGSTAIAYETVSADDGSLPLLAPMSEVAGRLSIQAGAHALEREHGGYGILLGGVAGVRPAQVVVIGGGVVGTNAIQMALGMGAMVTVLDKSLSRLRELDMIFGGRLNTIYATQQALDDYVTTADLVIGAVLVPGATAPRVVNCDMVKRMKSGAVIVDVAIDQGGCFETSHPTTHAEPTYIVEDVVHYCVANMPGAVP
ncbi:MAG TPA: alanine dehydrogenase, partial [Gammaproteobacteria bacterium]|nr:alanine dehydrogenase [Gammaproteobacteria bacterium]